MGVTAGGVVPCPWLNSGMSSLRQEVGVGSPVVQQGSMPSIPQYWHMDDAHEAIEGSHVERTFVQAMSAEYTDDSAEVMDASESAKSDKYEARLASAVVWGLLWMHEAQTKAMVKSSMENIFDYNDLTSSYDNNKVRRLTRQEQRRPGIILKVDAMKYILYSDSPR